MLLLTAATGAWAQEPVTTYSVGVKDATGHASEWTGKAGEGDFGAMPLTGVTEGQAVTLKYNGRLKVKAVTATSDAAPKPAPAGITVARAAYQGTNAPSQNWTAGDKLYVYGPGLVLMGTLEAEADGAEVLMAGTLDFTKTGTTAPMKLTLSTLPLPMDYRTQDGTQAKTTAYAMATATATAIDAEAGTVTLDATPTLEPQQALVKISLKNANGQPISASTLSLDALDPNGGYSTITKLQYDLPVEQTPTWAYGNYTYENGVITINDNGTGVGWPTGGLGEGMAQCTGITAVFAEGATGPGALNIQYLKNGATDPSYVNNSFPQGQTWAWIGVPGDAKEIWGIYFTANSSMTVKPTRISPNATGGLTLSPNGSDVYVALKDVGTSKLNIEAKAGSQSYFYNGSVTINNGSYYELSLTMASPYANVTTSDVGKIIGADGNIYANASAATNAGTTALAMIVYVGNDAETSTIYNHGLAVALSDAGGLERWCGQYSATCLPTQYNTTAGAKTDMAGIANTDALLGHGSAFSMARNYNGGNHPLGTSTWFLPSAGQWDKIAGGVGGYGNLISKLNLLTENIESYWTSTEYSEGSAWQLWLGATPPRFDYDAKISTFRVRPVLAF